MNVCGAYERVPVRGGSPNRGRYLTVVEDGVHDLLPERVERRELFLCGRPLRACAYDARDAREPLARRHALAAEVGSRIGAHVLELAVCWRQEWGRHDGPARVLTLHGLPRLVGEERRDEGVFCSRVVHKDKQRRTDESFQRLFLQGNRQKCM